MTPSSLIGHYRIVSKLGEGGMGAVYRATDTKLNRDVAVKVLPDALAGDPDFLARFVREAQVLASLNHPNIAIIHGVEDRALVMELVPGQTLDERIAAGPVPPEEALPIARQIAEALEAAHEKGVIHRDLKPANVKVTPEGVVKVLDFGLAKAAEPAAPASSANSPTLTIRATQAGLILGTAAYMAPEQAAGKPVDRRADIWSFGVVLHELLTGKRLFTGETISHTLASVLKDPIDCNLPQAPPPIRRLLARCLTRDPKERLRDIGEARIAIRDYLANPQAAAEPATADAPVSRTAFWWIPRVLAAALLLAASAALAWYLKPSPARTVMRFALLIPEGQSFTGASRLPIAISPDGTQIIYVANRQLYLRPLAELEAHPIGGSYLPNGLVHPIFSPDGKSVAFTDLFTQVMKRLPVSGGAPVSIGTVGSPNGASWDAEGILFASPPKGIQRVSANGGRPEVLIAAKDNELLMDPQLLPGGDTILFTVFPMEVGMLRRVNRGQIVVQNLKSGARKILVQEGTSAHYLATGHLIYQLNGILYAVAFNPRRLEIAGSPVGILEGVMHSAVTTYYAISESGSLVYMPGPVSAAGVQNVLARIDRKGEAEPLKMPPSACGFPRVSPDGSRVAYQVDDDDGSSVWICDLAAASAPRRLTLSGSGSNRYPIWSSDGQRVAFQSERQGDYGIWWQRADGSAAAERLTRAEKGVAHIPDSWSPDGQTFSFTEEKKGVSEVWTFSVRESKATLFASAPNALLGRSAFSPDGHWIAYQLNALPNSRVYVRPFPPTEAAYVAPEDFDMHHPVWTPNGKELFYVPGPSQLGSVTITTKPGVSFGSPTRAPKSGFITNVPATVRTFDVLPDGEHLIGIVNAGAAQSGTTTAPQIQVVLNWFEDVKQRVGQ